MFSYELVFVANLISVFWLLWCGLFLAFYNWKLCGVRPKVRQIAC